ncbi:MAG: helix-turn-helix domain-containing protein [Acidimicrobiales bacterium]|jgi:excisionase family DNA binding protein
MRRNRAPEEGVDEEPLPVKMTRQKRGVLPEHDEGEGYDSLLDYEAAAAYLCTTPRHVRELWARRQLAAIKVGRCVRFTKGDLDAFIAANRVSAARSTPSSPG